MDSSLDTDIRRLLDAAPPSPPLQHQPLAQVRARVAAGDGLSSGGPHLSRVEDRQVRVRDGTAIRLRWYRPDRPTATVVYLHGGGWVTGDLAYSDDLCRRLAASCDATVISLDYRLAPEHPFPTPLEDVEDVVRKLVASDGLARPLILAGDSAGGNLAAAAALSLRTDHTVDGQILVYPVLDADFRRGSYEDRWRGVIIDREAMSWFWDHYVPQHEFRKRAEASPLRAGQPAQTPPTLLVTAGFDPLYDEGVAYLERLRAAGVGTTHLHEASLPHGFCRFTGVSEGASAAAKRLSDAAASFLRSLGSAPG